MSVKDCQKPSPTTEVFHSIDYIAWHMEAEIRHKRGERQLFCTVCERWHWPDHLCKEAKTITLKEWKKRQKEHENETR